MFVAEGLEGIGCEDGHGDVEVGRGEALCGSIAVESLETFDDHDAGNLGP